MTRGFSNREIATEIHLSENTIKTHVQEIFRKLGVHNRVEAVMTATKHHWLRWWCVPVRFDNGSAQNAEVELSGPGSSSSRSHGCRSS